MSDPDIEMIQAAAEALNTTDARINAFLDNVDADVLAAISQAQTQLSIRQGQYDQKAADLEGIVEDKLTISIYVDAVAGNDANDGTAGSPVLKVSEALSRVVPGAYATINLAGDQIHELDGDAVLNSNSVTIRRTSGGDPTLLGKSKAVGSADHCYSITLRNSLIDFNNVIVKSGISARGAVHFSAGMIFTSLGGVVRFSNGDIEIGDFAIVRSYQGGFFSLVLIGVNLSRNAEAASAYGLAEGASLSFTASSVSIPSGDSFADYLPVARDAAGVPINIVSNIVL